jgi:hypothetical protein
VRDAFVHRYPQVESEFKQTAEISPGSVNSLGGLASVYGLEGRKRKQTKCFPK